MIYFTAHTFKCVCHCRRAMFRVLGMYNFDWKLTLKVRFCFFLTNCNSSTFGRCPFRFHQNFLNFFLVKDLTNRLLFPLFVSFWVHTCFARMWHLKNGQSLSAPHRAYFYHPQLLKKKIWWKLKSQSFHQKKIEEFWWKLKAYRPYP